MCPNNVWTSAAARRLLDLAGHNSGITNAVTIVAGKFLAGVSCPPTDLEALGAALNVLRFEAESLPISGELRREADGFVVAYSTFLSTPRRRFTIAHELAHAIFESTGPNCPRSGKELERLCDMLATELLMPRTVFFRECGGLLELSWQKISDLAVRFKTSLSTTSLHLAELLGATVFEVEGDHVAWAYGSIRKGPIARLHDDLKSVIEKTRRREVFVHRIYATTDTDGYGAWKVEGKAIGADGRVLLLMLPQRR